MIFYTEPVTGQAQASSREEPTTQAVLITEQEQLAP